MKKFLNILPDLKLSHEMTELFETVECEKVAASRDHSRIKIYIHSDRLIAHRPSGRLSGLFVARCLRTR